MTHAQVNGYGGLEINSAIKKSHREKLNTLSDALITIM